MVLGVDAGVLLALVGPDLAQKLLGEGLHLLGSKSDLPLNADDGEVACWLRAYFLPASGL
jgi:hypothetical protein